MNTNKSKYNKKTAKDTIMVLVAETNHDIVDGHKMNQDIVVEVE
jgi:hypothetical protein